MSDPVSITFLVRVPGSQLGAELPAGIDKAWCVTVRERASKGSAARVERVIAAFPTKQEAERALEAHERRVNHQRPM